MTRVEVIGDCMGVPVRFINSAERAAIYAICPDGSTTPKYIGSTIQVLKDRIRGHVYDARRGSDLPVHAWMRDNFGGFNVVVLSYVSALNREATEREWIDRLKPPLNLTDGGPSMSGYKFAGTLHAKRIAAGVRSGAHFHCERCGEKFWRKLNEIKKGNNRYCSRACSNARHKAVANAA